MAVKKWVMRAILIVGIASGLAACGGGGGTAPAGSTVTIQGTVPGSVFVAVDNDTNTEVVRATASGTPKTFSMTIPTGKKYRFYLMENESAGSGARVYPYFVGATNIFNMSDNVMGQTINLGTVAPDFTTGNASSTSSPMTHAGVTGMGASAAMPASLSSAMYAMDNLAGTWHYNVLSSSGTMSWSHGSLAVDNAGIGTMTGVVRNGASMPNLDNIPYTMSQGGMLHSSDDNTFQGVMSKDMSLFMATFTDNTGGYSMMIAQKRGGSFASTDMNGTWQFHRMTAASDNLTSGWAYGSMTISAGSGLIGSITTSNGSSAEIGRTFTFSMDGSGVMTESGDASFNGAMSAGKDMIVSTDNGANGPEMWILVRSGASFTMADMAGDWMMNGLIAGNAGSRDWMNGQSVMTAAGQMTLPQMMGHGGAMSMAQSTLSMNSGGAVTMTGMSSGMGGMMGSTVTQTYHATMSPSKTLLVSTYSDGTGGHRLTVQLK